MGVADIITHGTTSSAIVWYVSIKMYEAFESNAIGMTTAY